jgi:hypothetical protein
MLAATILGVACCLLVGATALTWYSSAGSDRPARVKLVLAPGLVGVVALVLVGRVLPAGTNMWNGARLTPSAALLKGFRLYPAPEEGPVSGHIYGPVSPLCYLPAAALPSPRAALVAASLSSALFLFGPVVLLLRKALTRARPRSAALTWVYLSAFVVLVAVTCPTLNYVAFSVHCDAPALGLATLAVVALAFGRNGLPASAFSAVFAVLAFWCKLTLVGLFPALTLSVLLVDGWRAAFRYAACILAFGAAVTAAVLVAFGPQEVAFNVFAVPAAHPWGELVKWQPGHVLSQSYPDAVAVRAKWLLVAAAKYWENSGIIVVALVCSGYLYLRRGKRTPRDRSLSLLTTSLLLAFLVSLPISLAAKAKVGGDVNAYAHSLFFALVLAAAWLGVSLGDGAEPRVAWIPEVAFLLVAAINLWAVCAVVPRAVRSAHEFAGRNDPATNRTLQVYQYTASHPGEAYFPWYPLPCLLTEGRLYHFCYGVFDRELAGRRIRDEHFLRYIPANPRYVCFDDVSNWEVNEYVLSYLQDYHRVPAPPELKGWHVYARD